MHWIGELLRERGIGLVGRHLLIARFLAIRAPMPLIGARFGVEHNDAAILIAIGDIKFVRLLIERDMGRPAKLVRAVGIAGGIRVANLVEKFPVSGEGKDLMVDIIVAGEPDVALTVDMDAVLRFRPVIALAGAAPI